MGMRAYTRNFKRCQELHVLHSGNVLAVMKTHKAGVGEKKVEVLEVC